MLQMGKLFLGLAFWNTVLFVVTIWMGFTDAPRYWQHFTCGVITGLFTCLTHCIVMMHFMGSGKAIKEGISTHGIADDPQTGYVRRGRRLHGRASGMATMASMAIIVAVWLGGWVHTRPNVAAAQAWHRWFTWGAVTFNLYAFWVEFRVIRENTGIIRAINAQIAAKSPP